RQSPATSTNVSSYFSRAAAGRVLASNATMRRAKIWATAVSGSFASMKSHRHRNCRVVTERLEGERTGQSARRNSPFVPDRSGRVKPGRTRRGRRKPERPLAVPELHATTDPQSVRQGNNTERDDQHDQAEN